MAGDAVSIAPHVYKVISENDKVRILDSTMDPGRENRDALPSGGGSHRADQRQGEIHAARRSDKGGELEPGHAMYMDAADHATENVGSNAIRVILVEIK
jgi:hypothetical protein